MKTLAIKLEDGTHGQLTAIAQLEGQPVTLLIKQAVELFIESKRNHPELTARAADALEEIERHQIRGKAIGAAPLRIKVGELASLTGIFRHRLQAHVLDEGRDEALLVLDLHRVERAAVRVDAD